MKNYHRGRYDRYSAMSAFGEGGIPEPKGLKEVRENLDRRLRSRWLAEAKVSAGEGDALGHVGQFLVVRFDPFDARQQAGLVGDLDGQARPGVEFQEQGSLVAVQDQIHPQVAQWRVRNSGRPSASMVSQWGMATPWILRPVSGCSRTIS